MDKHDLHNQTHPQTMLDDGMRRRAAEEFGVELGLTDGRLSLRQRSTRQWGVSMAALAVGVGCFFLPAYLPQSGFAADVVRISAVIFGASLLLLAAYLPYTSVDVRISRRRVERVRRCWGIAFKRRSVPAEDFDDLCIDPGRSGTIGRSYDLVGRGAFGKLKLIDDVPDREFLDAIRRQIMLAAGLRPSGTH